jgi:hypothetical protein
MLLKKTITRKILQTVVFICMSRVFTGCFADKDYAYKRETEKEDLHCSNPEGLPENYLMKKFFELIPRTAGGIDSNTIDPLARRLQKAGTSRGAAGGLIAALATNLIGGAVTAISTIVANEQSKYTAISKFALAGAYFYDQPSVDGPFDPVGMQFKGFDVVRTVTGNDGRLDTAFIARFALDTSSPEEILYNSIFGLKMTEFREKYIKPKVSSANRKKNMSVDFDISFVASFINEDGNPVDNLVLGKFHKLVSGISLDMQKDNFGKSPDKDSSVDGKSFIVPRSYAYVVNGTKVEKGFNRGLYSILVTVKESTNPTYATKMIVENGNIIVKTVSDDISTKVTKEIKR